MPTTEVLTWDCPECCDDPDPPVGDPCDPASIAPVASGLIEGSLALLPPDPPWDAKWQLTSAPPGTECVVTVYVHCDGGVVTAGWFMYWPGGAATGTGTVVSTSPLLIEYNVVGWGACLGGLVTVTM